MAEIKKETPFIVPLFIPHIGCPFQCAFCNQKAITSISRSTITEDKVREDIETFLSYKKENKKKTELAFYGGTFLGLEKSNLTMLLDIAQSYVNKGDIDTIRFSTRPDTITSENLDLIEKYSVETIEVGVQSMDDNVLKSSNRGHTRADVINAVRRIKERKYTTGIQLMVGLPGDNEEIALKTTMETIALKPDIVRIYPTLVLKDSPMEVWFNNGSYRPHSLEQSVSIVKKMLVLFQSENIKVIRIGIQASKDLEEGSEIISGPYHPSYGHIVSSEIFFDMMENEILNQKIPRRVEIEFNPSRGSEIRGLKNSNIDRLKNIFDLTEIILTQNNNIQNSDLLINGKKTGISDLVHLYKKP